MSVELIAVKPLKYRGRLRQPGEIVRVRSEREARVLVHLKKAERTRNEDRLVALDDARAAVELPPLSQAGEDIRAVRTEYEKAMGRKPFTGWSIETMRARMKAAV